MQKSESYRGKCKLTKESALGKVELPHSGLRGLHLLHAFMAGEME